MKKENRAFTDKEVQPDSKGKELGEEVIWESGFGYDIGYRIKGSFDGIGEMIRITSGEHTGDICVLSVMVAPYSEASIDELTERYGYEKRFSRTF